jgi:aerobic carbon-monoxide dehydrogenase large subunit
MSFIGQSVRRLEDRPLLTGAGRFIADLKFPGMVTMRVVRSPVAHGRLTGFDLTAARAHPGTIAIWIGADIAEIPPIGFRLSPIPGLEPYRQPVLAQDVVRYVGEPIALVFAADAYVAEDIADLVTPLIESLPPCPDSTAPPAEFAPGLDSEAAVITKVYGDLDAAFARAHAVVELELATARHSGVPLETRGALAVPDAASGILRMYGAAKVPHFNRQAIETGSRAPAKRASTLSAQRSPLQSTTRSASPAQSRSCRSPRRGSTHCSCQIDPPTFPRSQWGMPTGL